MSLPEITALCRVLGRSNANDTSEQSRNLARLQELQSYLEPYAHPGINACLEAASTMVELLASKGVPDRERILETVCRTMAAVEKNWAGPDPDSVLISRLDEAQGDCDGPAMLKSTVFTEDDPEKIDAAQRRLEQLKSTPRINEMVMGELLVELGHVSAAQIRECLDLQGDSGNLLGQVLVEEGYCTDKLIEETARLQRQLRNTSTAESLGLKAPEPKAGEPKAGGQELEAKSELKLNFVNKPVERGPSPFAPTEETFLGQIMVSQEMIAAEQLERALKVQRASGVRIGEALVEIGAATWDQVEEAVESQTRLRRAAGLVPRSLSF